MKRKLIALGCCVLMAFGGVSAMAQPASAHGAEVCYTVTTHVRVSTGYTVEVVEVRDDGSEIVRFVENFAWVPQTTRHCSTSYDHTHSFCEQWRTQTTNPDTMTVEGNVEVGAVGTLICALWVQRGH